MMNTGCGNMTDPKLILLQDLMKRTHELELQLQVPYIDYKRIQTSELYASYCKVLVDMGLWMCYNELYNTKGTKDDERNIET